MSSGKGVANNFLDQSYSMLETLANEKGFQNDLFTKVKNKGIQVKLL